MRRLLVTLLMCVCGACAETEDTPGSGAVGDSRTLPSAPDQAATARRGPTVVFLGTSLTAGLGLQRDEDTYVARVAALADSAGLPIHAVNAGVSGETSAGGLRRLDWVLREPLDVLVLELGANDGLRGQDPAALETNLRAIIDRTRTRYPGTAVVIAGMEAPPNFGRLYTERFRSVFASVAESAAAELIPFLLEGVAGIAALNQDDRLHPTAEGHQLVARTVWPVLETVLRQLDAGR